MSLGCPECGRPHSEFDPRCLDCGTPLPTATAASPLPQGPLPGISGRLGRFEILGELGRGGMGVVFRARDLELGREVALKLLAAVAERDELLREARAVAALDHPAIGGLYEVGSSTHGSFLVLPFYQGETLAAELGRRGFLPPLEAILILQQLASALAAAHAAGIVHRDVKPSNIFRRDDGSIKLLDFGIARQSEAGSDGSGSGSQGLIGTAAYLAPELFRGQDSGSARDLWSLGIVGWEMIAGRHPFDPAQPGWLERLAAGALDRQKLPPDLPPGLTAAIAACLSTDPSERPSAAKLAEDFAQLAAALRQPAPARARWRPGAPGLGLAAALSVVVALFLWPRASPPRLVTVLSPKIEGALPAVDASRFAANLEATSWRTLTRLEGVETLERNLARQAPGEPAAAARASAADETIGWEAMCPGVDLCSVRLLRRDHQGRELGFEALELSVASDALSSRAAAAALRRLYPDRALKNSTPEPELDADTYRRFLELRSALERRELTPESALEKLDSWGEEGTLPELVALEAGVCRFLFSRDRSEKWLQRGLRAADRGVHLYPADSLLLATRFDLLLEARRMPAAAEALRALERSGAGLAEVLLRSARLAEAEGRAEEALAVLRRLAQDRPAAPFLLSLANLEQRLGQTEAAREHLEKALQRAPDNAQARASLAGLDLIAGRLEAAEKGWRQLAERARSVDVFNNYGLVLLLRRRYEEAEQAFRQALEMAPESDESLLNLADTLGLQGQSAAAEPLYRRLIAKKPGAGPADWQAWAVRAQAAAHLGDDDAARTALAEMRRRAPGSGEVAISAALVLTLLGDNQAALEEARRAVAAGSGRIWFELPLFDPLAELLGRAGIRSSSFSTEGKSDPAAPP